MLANSIHLNPKCKNTREISSKSRFLIPIRCACCTWWSQRISWNYQNKSTFFPRLSATSKRRKRWSQCIPKTASMTRFTFSQLSWIIGRRSRIGHSSSLSIISTSPHTSRRAPNQENLFSSVETPLRLHSSCHHSIHRSVKWKWNQTRRKQRYSKCLFTEKNRRMESMSLLHARICTTLDCCRKSDLLWPSSIYNRIKNIVLQSDRLTRMMSQEILEKRVKISCVCILYL